MHSSHGTLLGPKKSPTSKVTPWWLCCLRHPQSCHTREQCSGVQTAAKRRERGSHRHALWRSYPVRISDSRQRGQAAARRHQGQSTDDELHCRPLTLSAQAEVHIQGKQRQVTAAVREPVTACKLQSGASAGHDEHMAFPGRQDAHQSLCIQQRSAHKVTVCAAAHNVLSGESLLRWAALTRPRWLCGSLGA